MILCNSRRLCGALVALFFFASFFTPGVPVLSQDGPLVYGLRCEYLVDPLGIDVEVPRLSWILASPEKGARQSAYHILVSSSPEELGRDTGDLWDSGRVESDQSVFVPYGGKALTSGTRCYWKVRVWDRNGNGSEWSPHAHWSMGLLQKSDWKGDWIGLPHSEETTEGTPLPFPWLRRTFELEDVPARATAYVNSLGYYELYINGRKVDDHVLSPAVSDYSRRNLYVTHDVTDYLEAGKNCVAVWLGRGWYVRGHPGVVHDGPLVRAQIDWLLADGASGGVATDQSWKVHASPITPLGKGLAFGDYGGERYDARLEIADWNGIDFDDSEWPVAGRFEPPSVVTAAQMVEPNRIQDAISPVKVSQYDEGGYLIDLGRNFTGWFLLRIPAGLRAGTVVRLEYAELVRDPNHTVTDGGGRRRPRLQTWNQYDEFVSDGSEHWFRSRFNYHGFRYVRVTGLERAPRVGDARGHLIHTDYYGYGWGGNFESSNELLNRIYEMVTWTYRSLTLGGYVVDCPTRERLGYGGDAGTSLETGMFNFAVGGLYNRWLADWRAAQHPETGNLPHTAPHYPDQGGGGPMWGGFVVTLPWQMYLQYGDQRVLEVNYDMIRKWLAFLETETVDHVLMGHTSYAMSMPRWNFLGDWVTPWPVGEPSPESPFGDLGSTRFINSLHYLYTVQLAARMADLLGHSGEAAAYRSLAEARAPKLHEKFYDPERETYVTGEQPYLAFPLLLGVVPPELRDRIAEKLEHLILVEDGGNINAGMHGTYFLLKYLMEQGRNDLIFEMATQTDYPGWGYMLEQGATTAWEDWKGELSQIHDTLISIGAWFIQGLGGIQIDEENPGFRHFFVKPAPVGDLEFVGTHYDSPYGRIFSNWRVEGTTFTLVVIVPSGATATIHIPTSEPGSVTESGRPALEAPGVRPLEPDVGVERFLVEAGSYRFTANLARR